MSHRLRAAITALAMVAMTAVLGPSTLARATTATKTATPPADGSMTLTYQTPWVGASGDFSLRLRIERPKGPPDPEVAVSIYPAVATRSEFALTLSDKIGPAPVIAPQISPLSSLVSEPGSVPERSGGSVPERSGGSVPERSGGSGEVTLNLHLADRLSLGKVDGVFPVRVDLRDPAGGRVLQRITTHLVYMPVQPMGTKLGMAMVLPVHASAGLPPSGARQLRGIDDLAELSSALDATQGMPLTLAPNPETLATLAASSDDKAVTALGALQRRATTATVLGGTYVPTSLPALLANGLSCDATTQMARGSDTITDTLHVRPDTRTWLTQGDLDDPSLALLGQRGFDRVVARDTDLKPLTAQKLTITQPFLLSGGARQVPAVAADTGLSAYFDNGVAPALAANHLLADLAVVYLDRPGTDSRGVVAMAPPTWRVNRQFLDTVVSGLTQNPIVEPISLDGLFTGVAEAKTESGRPVQRLVAPPAPGGLADMATGLRNGRVRLDGLGSVLGPGAADHGNLDERLLLAESTEFRTNRQRQAYLDAVLAGIDSQRQDIRMPGGRSITLTARSAEIPVTFQNRTGMPAKVVVKVQSDKLDFPRGSTQVVDLTRLNTTQRFSVVSRTSGAFPLRITLESPDGNLIIGQARLTVRSAAASGISLVVSLGAAIFLAVWWGRHALRGRRARRLVPA